MSDSLSNKSPSVQYIPHYNSLYALHVYHTITMFPDNSTTAYAIEMCISIIVIESSDFNKDSTLNPQGQGTILMVEAKDTALKAKAQSSWSTPRTQPSRPRPQLLSLRPRPRPMKDNVKRMCKNCWSNVTVTKLKFAYFMERT